MSLKNKKIRINREIDLTLAEAIRSRLKDGKLDCAAAFALAREKNLTPLAVGEAADSLGIRLSHCQLGLFGFPGHGKAWENPGWKEIPIPKDLEAAIRSVLDPDRSLSCAMAWKLASRFGIDRVHLGFLASRLHIKIKRCQLGAF